jgi:hypothetical protein
MISVQELRDSILHALDAENSDHYRDDMDIIPAINVAMKWLTSVVNAAIGQNKIGEEFFRDISYAGVFMTNNNSRVSLNVFPSEVWSILAIYVDPQTEVDPSLPVPSTPDTKQSYYLSNLIHVYASLDCKRLSIEEWANNSVNPFEHGYDGDQLCNDLKFYAYLNPINYSLSGPSTKLQHIEIRPKSQNEMVTIFWAKKPSVVTSLADNIDFPSSVYDLLFNKALNYISYKQGDQTNLYTVTSTDIQTLINVL